jgi:hypothetical protein
VADDTRLRDLTAACPATREAGEGDAVAGLGPRYASPATVEEASALPRAAAEHDPTAVARGGTGPSWVAPASHCDPVIGTRPLAHALQHPSDGPGQVRRG